MKVCRLAYEIMNSKHTDASQNFRSLDDIYYFGGQQEHRVEAISPHYAINENELNLTVGDIIAIAGTSLYQILFSKVEIYETL